MGASFQTEAYHLTSPEVCLLALWIKPFFFPHHIISPFSTPFNQIYFSLHKAIADLHQEIVDLFDLRRHCDRDLPSPLGHYASNELRGTRERRD